MSAYLAKLKQIENLKNSHCAPCIEPTKPTKVPSDPFGGKNRGCIEEKFIDREKLEALVRLCAQHYQFTEAELTEAFDLALTDPVNALAAYSSVAETIMKEQKEPQEAPHITVVPTHQYKGAECGNCSNLSMAKHSPTPDSRRIFQWTCKAGFTPLVVGYGSERVLVAPEECDCYAGAKVH